MSKKANLLALATEHRIAAKQCRKYPTISQVNLEMAEWYERQAKMVLVADYIDEE